MLDKVVIRKSLGDYSIERSSSVDVKNIKWTLKNPKDTESKKRKPKKSQISATNIIYTKDTKPVEKFFKVEEDDNEKPKKKIGKRHQKSSASNCNIQQGFKRPGR